jgi:thiol-disulfide isomerase/thioredoxin
MLDAMKTIRFILLSAVSLLWISFAHADTQKLALLVGVSDYFHKNMDDLSYAENDVDAVGDELRRLGFDATVVSGDQATRQNVNQALSTLLDKASKLESNGIVFLMFSGHGQELKTTESSPSGRSSVHQTPFFCPRDAVPFDPRRHTLRGKDAEAIASEFNLVSLNHVIEQLDQRSNSRKNLMVVDACRNNPAKGKSAGVTGSTAVNLPQGISILFAAKSGQKSWESTDPEIKHGVMTHYLLKGLRGDAINRRSQITWSRLVSYVREEVEFDGGKLAGGRDRHQTPHMIANNDSVITLSQPLFPHLGKANWIQDKNNFGSKLNFQSDWNYVVEFWPELSDQTQEELTSHLAKRFGFPVHWRSVIIIDDSPEKVRSFLESKRDSTSTVGEKYPGISFAADPGLQSGQIRFSDAELAKAPCASLYKLPSTPAWTGGIEELYEFAASEKRAEKRLFQERAILAIGAPAPELKVTDWFTDGDGKFKRDTRFREGNIYVVEIWTTWCAPCLRVMPDLARLQREYADKNVRIFSVSNEEPDEINEFLNKEFPERLFDILKADVRPATFREAYQSFSVASDTTNSTWDRYMTGLGQDAFPHCVIVGRSGLIEWMGHTVEVAEPLQRVVDDTWDRGTFKKERKTKLRTEQDTATVVNLYEEKQYDEALEFAVARFNEAKEEEIRDHWNNIRHHLKLVTNKLDDDTLSYFRARFAALQSEKNLQGILQLSNELCSINELGGEMGSLVKEAIDTVAKAGIDAGADGEKDSKNLQAYYYNTLALLYEVNGEFTKAIKAQEESMSLVEKSQAKTMEKYLAELKEKAGIKNGK